MPVKMAGVVGLGGLGFYLSATLPEMLPWNFNAAFVGLIFLEVGYMVRVHNIVEKVGDRESLTIISAITAAAFSFICTRYNTQVDMWYRLYGIIPLFLLGAFSGITLLLLCSKFLEKHFSYAKRIFTYYGQNTWPIIEFHIFPGYVILETLCWKIFKVAYMHNSLSGEAEGIIYAFTVLLLLVPVIEIFNQYFPWMVGKKNGQYHRPNLQG